MSPISLGGATLNYAICCDDIRVEDTGKFLFIGVYADMVLNAVPVQIAPRFVVQCVTTDSPQRDLQFRVKVADRVQAMSHLKRDPAASVPAGVPFFLPLPPMPLRVAEAGVIALEVEVGTDEWAKLLEIPVSLAPGGAAV